MKVIFRTVIIVALLVIMAACNQDRNESSTDTPSSTIESPSSEPDTAVQDSLMADENIRVLSEQEIKQ